MIFPRLAEPRRKAGAVRQSDGGSQCNVNKEIVEIVRYFKYGYNLRRFSCMTDTMNIFDSEQQKSSQDDI